MATNKLQWKRIAKGDKLPCQSFLRKKDGEILKLSTVGGVKVGQDCYYLPVDEVINVIKDYPVEENKDEKIINNIRKVIGWYRGMFTEKSLMPEQYQEIGAWLEKQCEQKIADGTFVNVDDVRDDFVQEVYRVLDADSINDRANQIIDAFDNLPTVAIEKQGEQKPYGLREECKDCQCNYAGECKGSCAMKRGEQKTSEWSEEDEDMLYKAIAVINRLCAEGKEYVWSISTLKKLFYWLKSLKDKYIWKPSDKQIEAVRIAIGDEQGSDCCDILRSLLKDLKSL